MKPRYQVTAPVEGGYAWWNVIDTHSHLYWGEDNFAVATVSIRVKDAEVRARLLCAALNDPELFPADKSIWDWLDEPTK